LDLTAVQRLKDFETSERLLSMFLKCNILRVVNKTERFIKIKLL
jgi:hypothetical protein